jgi:hypothetical protein
MTIVIKDEDVFRYGFPHPCDKKNHRITGGGRSQRD